MNLNRRGARPITQVRTIIGRIFREASCPVRSLALDSNVGVCENPNPRLLTALVMLTFVGFHGQPCGRGCVKTRTFRARGLVQGCVSNTRSARRVPCLDSPRQPVQRLFA